MKQYRYILFFIITLMTISASAYNSDEARKILDKASTKINIKSGATANFSIKNGNMGTQSGTIKVKGNKYCVQSQSGIIWYDGKTQWTYNKKSDEVHVSTPSASQQQQMNPYTFLTLYKSGYNMSMTNSAGNYQIHLTGKTAKMKEMYVLIDKNYNIKQVKIKQRNTWTTITVSKFQTTPLSDNYFTFNSKDYPKAEVIDLR